jgi:thiamine biosynthesis lipoprotein
MGTWFEVWLAGEDPSHLADVAEAILDEVARIEERLSWRDPRSEVSRVNREAAHGPVRVDREVFKLLEICRRGWFETGGAFDVTAGSSRRDGVFGGVSYADVILNQDDRSVRFPARSLRIDLGGIGKGHALDRAAEMLDAFGVRNALLHGGTSSVMARGRTPSGSSWSVGVRDPWAFDDDEQVTRLELADRALACSTALGWGHASSDLIDPRTGMALREQSGCVVLAESATKAEVLSTALICMGRDEAEEWLASRPDPSRSVLWIDAPDSKSRLDWIEQGIRAGGSAA